MSLMLQAIGYAVVVTFGLTALWKLKGSAQFPASARYASKRL